MQPAHVLSLQEPDDQGVLYKDENTCVQTTSYLVPGMISINKHRDSYQIPLGLSMFAGSSSSTLP